MKHENNPIQHILKIKKHLGGGVEGSEGIEQKRTHGHGLQCGDCGGEGRGRGDKWWWKKINK